MTTPTPQSSTTPEPPAANWHYESSVAEVEAIIDRIESGELDLEDVFEQFSQAMTMLQECERFLASRQAQADLLIETLNDTATS